MGDEGWDRTSCYMEDYCCSHVLVLTSNPRRGGCVSILADSYIAYAV